MKNFNVIDEEFICSNCGKHVNKLGTSCRDHCNHCLFSIHLDINPGDRMSDCKGVMEPIGIEKYRDSYKIVYKCKKCNMLHRNIMAIDDNYDVIIELSKNS